MNNKALDRRVKKHIIAGKHTLFIPVIPGLEEPAIQELEKLGLKPQKEKEPGSLTVEGSLEDLWKTALFSRCASRLYLRLLSFKAEGFREFRNKSCSFPWELYLKQGSEYRLRFSLSHCRLHVTDNIGKSLYRSIRERFEEMEGRAPQLIEDKSPHVDPDVQTILVRGTDNHFTLSLDASGGPLYDRGYRPFVTEAPIRETLAASLLLAAGITRSTLLIDPMCGSGTFQMEAAVISSGIPSGLTRTFPFEFWPSFRPARYNWLREKEISFLRPSCRILSSDISPDALQAASDNKVQFLKMMREKGLEETAGLYEKSSELTQADFFNSPCPAFEEGEEPLLILNPPYGMRLALKDRLAFFRKLGEKIQKDYKGVRWGIIAPGLDAEKAFGLHWEKKYLFKNGGIPVSFLTGRS